MDIYYSIVTIQFMILRIVSTESPEIVTFNVKLSQDENLEVNLVPIESFLANKNVPVWITSKNFPDGIERVNNVMQNVGPLSFYQDPKTCATAVYFHKQQSFHGIVGYHHVIDNLPYNSRTKSVVPTDDTVFPSLLEKHNEKLPDDEIIHEVEGYEPPTWDDSLLPFPHTVYIETLVIVNYDILQELKDYTEIASFVVKLFNNVDMMFSRIKKPNIKFNIAGIIIEKERELFLKSPGKSCYRLGKNNENQLDADCLLDAISNNLHEHQTVSPRSYDIALFLTRYKLIRITKKISKSGRRRPTRKVIEGISVMPNPEYSYGLDIEDMIFGVASLYSDAILPVTAHEIAHMLGAGHDGGPLFRSDRRCVAHLMKHNDGYCKRCFRFGGKTPKEFMKFFGSRQACIFRNKPRSLHPSRPEVFWTKKKQCECYGFPEALLERSSRTSSHAVDCRSRLQCIAEDHQTHHTGLFMDGTPCDRKRIGTKVCWNSKCLPILPDP